MKTAISIPDDLFEEAEELAERLHKSRSQLFSEAVAEFIARHCPESITEAMDAVCREVETEGSDPFVATAAQRTLERTEW